jgi:hypothetical protein
MTREQSENFGLANKAIKTLVSTNLKAREDEWVGKGLYNVL